MEKTLGQIAYESFCEGLLKRYPDVEQHGWENMTEDSKELYENAAKAVVSEANKRAANALFDLKDKLPYILSLINGND